MSEVKASKLAITKERIKAWEACSSGYKWFLEKFPQGSDFADVYAALKADKRYENSGWLADRVFAELDTNERVLQIVNISGADKKAIEILASDGDVAATTGEGANAATTGNYANAATTGEGAVAAAFGIDSVAKANAGGAIVIVRRDQNSKLLAIFSSMVGQNGIEADKWYGLDENNQPIEKNDLNN